MREREQLNASSGRGTISSRLGGGTTTLLALRFSAPYRMGIERAVLAHRDPLIHFKEVGPCDVFLGYLFYCWCCWP